MIARWSLALCLMVITSAACGDSLKTYPRAVSFTPFENEFLKLERVTALSSTDSRFGGFSALLEDQDGFLSLTDQGHMARFSKDFSRVELLILREKNDDPLMGKDRSDGESLAKGPMGQVYVAFERDHRIVPYNAAGYVMGKDLVLPGKVRKLKKNSGLEAIETLQDGRLVLLAEGRSDDGKTDLWVETKNGWDHDPLALKDDFRPTGLARVPGSDQLILMERFYKPLEGVRIRLSALDIKKVKRTLLGELGPPLPLDNFEGITALKSENGETRLILISDDNFSALQRTLVMEFVLKK